MTVFFKYLRVGIIGATMALATFFYAGNVAHAADVSAFLQGLDGKFRGRGKATYAGGKKTVKVSCQIANKVSADKSKLKISGVCATTQGKASVKGELRFRGSKVSGAFFSPGVRMKLTKSSGSIKGNQLVIVSYFIDTGSGALTRIKQIVKRGKGGFSSRVLTYDNASKKYKQSGSIKFKKRK